MAHKLKNGVWCWVAGWVYLLHQKDLDRAQELGITWIRPASDEEVKNTLAQLKTPLHRGPGDYA